ncbi:Protein E6 [Linum perenne]
MASQTLAALLLITLLSSAAVHGRESHFFSKVAAATNPTTVTVTPNNKDVQQQQQPSFVQETDNNGYGLYGHESPETTSSFDQATTKLASDNDAYAATFHAGNNPNTLSESYYNNDKYYGEKGYKSVNDESDELAGSFNERQQSGYVKKSLVGVSNSDEDFAGNRLYNNNLDKKEYAGGRFPDESSNGVANFYNNDAYRGNTFDESRNGAVSNPYNNNVEEQRMNQQYGNSFSEVPRNGVGNTLYGNSAEEQQGMKQQQYGNSFSDDSSKTVANNLYGNSFSDESQNGVVNGYVNKNRVERQGMSDTRYVAGGKYYVDVNNPNQYPGFSSVNRNDEYYGNSMNRNGNQQQHETEYFQGNNYQNEQYDP